MDGWQDVVWGVVGISITALAGTGIGVLVAWIKNLGWIKKLKIDSAINKAAEIAISYAENWGKKMSALGAEKLNKAKDVFQVELKRQGIKLDAGQMETRLEAIFTQIKGWVEHKPDKKPE